jgi:hypothetical protein
LLLPLLLSACWLLHIVWPCGCLWRHLSVHASVASHTNKSFLLCTKLKLTTTTTLLLLLLMLLMLTLL